MQTSRLSYDVMWRKLRNSHYLAFTSCTQKRSITSKDWIATSSQEESFFETESEKSRSEDETIEVEANVWETENNIQDDSLETYADEPLADQWLQNCQLEQAKRDQLEELTRAGKVSWKRRSCGWLVSFLDSSAGYCFERSTATKELYIFYIALEPV